MLTKRRSSICLYTLLSVGVIRKPECTEGNSTYIMYTNTRSQGDHTYRWVGCSRMRLPLI